MQARFHLRLGRPLHSAAFAHQEGECYPPAKPGLLAPNFNDGLLPTISSIADVTTVDEHLRAIFVGSRKPMLFVIQDPPLHRRSSNWLSLLAAALRSTSQPTASGLPRLDQLPFHGECHLFIAVIEMSISPEAESV